MKDMAHKIRPEDKHVGIRIKVLRNIHGRTQSWLGDQIGVSFQQLQKYETGANRVSPSRLCDIGKALDVPPSYFFNGIDGQQPGNDAIKTRAELLLLNDFRVLSGPQQTAFCRLAKEIAKGANGNG